MNAFIIRAWVNDVNTALNFTTASQNMSSPSKRARTNTDYLDLRLDPHQTPTRTRLQLARARSENDHVFSDPAAFTTAPSESSFAALLASRSGFSAPLRPQQSPSTTSRSRSVSPIQHFRKTVDLLNLVPPVRFADGKEFERNLPEDLQPLVNSLFMAVDKEGILPEALRDDIARQSTRTRPSWWKKKTKEDDIPALEKNLASLQNIVDESVDSTNLFRSEAAWNCLVHTPLLKYATSGYNFLRVEPITSAGIAIPFRPVLQTGRHISSASSTNTTSHDDETSSQAQTNPAATSINNMVDFALVLEPGNELKAVIKQFLSCQDIKGATINQTLYEPLRSRPACVFIETKVGSGTADAANCQLGVWVAAWHERMRRIISLAGRQGQERVLTIPVIQVVNSIWTLLFVVDAGSEIVSIALYLVK
ncbi:hypothetical protein F66182_4941 [Fusarium sp. NRRL 66182]|nr:hypothetical protein F66182_4941 [Fusarium sp. NRRL 66182]